MKKMLSKKWISIVAIALVAVVGIVVFYENNSNVETVLVEQRDLKNEIVLVGEVESRDFVELGLSASGRIEKIYAQEGDMVKRGDPIVRLESGSILARRAEAQARLDLLLAETDTDSTVVADIEKKYETMIASLRQKMFSADLRATSQNDTDLDAPLITGLYTGEAGMYKIIVRDKNNVGDYEMYVFDNEKIAPKEIESGIPVALGTKGLFIEFEEEVSDYVDTIWYVDIPNTAGSSYVQNYTTYQDALASRDEELTRARSGLSGNDAVLSGRIAEAKSVIAGYDAQLRERTIYASFDGEISYLDKKEGELATAGEIIVSLIGDRKEKIVQLEIPEIDAPYMKTGLTALITPDAFPLKGFTGTVSLVDFVSTDISGVSVYKGEVEVDYDSEVELLDGMTVKVSIILESVDDVLSVPLYSVNEEKGESYVYVQGMNGEEKRLVALGLKSSDGYVEVLEGLQEGEVVIIK